MVKLNAAVLEGVAETALFTLWFRGSEASRPDAIITDPHAVRLLEDLDYPFRRKFGDPNQIYAIRALTFDGVVREFLAEHPNGTVVALAEGLQTSYWRLGSADCRWLSVDLPEIVSIRSQLLPAEPNIVSVGASALDLGWAEHIPPDEPVLITAEGLLYYLDEQAALGLIEDCARRFPGGRIVFDSVPPWWAGRRNKAFGVGSAVTGSSVGTEGYVFPPMPFGMTPARIRRFPRQLAGVASTRHIRPPAGRGLQGRIIQAAYHNPALPDALRFAVTEVRFRGGTRGD
ncbi:class I SAM-dependent methyltransferase [Nocardia sp. NPDC057668]|uniref:class I SAM-dependent methyltransferase n=1 Tax=Nocardia sp. NPDC057668 TaxID=3346202 RepID=UPI00366C8A1C